MSDSDTDEVASVASTIEDPTATFVRRYPQYNASNLTTLNVTFSSCGYYVYVTYSHPLVEFIETNVGYLATLLYHYEYNTQNAEYVRMNRSFFESIVDTLKTHFFRT